MLFFLKNRLSLFYTIIIALFVIFLFTPAKTVHAEISVTCCRCVLSGAGKQSYLCLEQTSMQNCDQAQAVVKDKIKASGEKIGVLCKPLDQDKCQQIEESPKAGCSSKPTNTSKITENEILSLLGIVKPPPDPIAYEDTASSVYQDVNLNVSIPGIKMPGQLNISAGSIQVPYLAIYISGIQKYLFGITIILAAVMFTFGAFKYLLASTGIAIEHAKDLMIDSIAGMTLVLSAYVILVSVNPNTTVLGTLQMPYIERDVIDMMPKISSIPAANTTGGPVADGTFTKQDIIDAVKWAADELKINDCAFLAICEHETGFKHLWSGQRKLENAGAHGPCGTLTRFLMSETSFSKAMREKFPDMPPIGTPMGEMGHWLVYNPKAGAYYGALMFKGKSSNPVMALDQYSSGGANYPNWLKGHSECQAIIKGLSTWKAASTAIESVKKCIPDFIAVPSMECKKWNNNKKCVKSVVNPKTACAPSYECPAEIDKTTSEFWGKCADNPAQKCLAMKMSDIIPYVLKRYPGMKAYGCKAEN